VVFPARFPGRLRARGSAAALALVGAGLALACARYDLDISRALVQPEAGWAAFGQRYGELPGVYVFALAAVAGHARPARPEAQPKLARELPWLLCSIAVAIALALSAYRLFDYRLGKLEVAATWAVTLLATRIWRRWLGAGLRLRPGWERARLWTLRLGIWSWLVVSVLKLGWGRVRYRDLTPLARDFTPWYAPQGWSGHSSFPSGHAVLGWLLLPSLLIWPPGSPGYRWAFAASFGWGVFVASSRVVIGAHYLSDVLFSSALVFAVMAFALGRAGNVAAEGDQRADAGRTAPLEDGR
jgi:membrane-associated phospholipid phosphatase